LGSSGGQWGESGHKEVKSGEWDLKKSLIFWGKISKNKQIWFSKPEIKKTDSEVP
jgi:hypothetical protein